MAEFIYLNRDTRFFVQLGENLWEVPILADYGFTQATESSEVTLSEAEDSSGDSIRGRATFNDALNPAEWNINAYLRPYKLDTDDDDSGDNTADLQYTIDEVLWAALAGADKYGNPSGSVTVKGKSLGSSVSVFHRGGSAPTATNTVTSRDATSMFVDFTQSNKSQQPEGLTLYFVVGQDALVSSTSGKRVMRLSRASVNEASLTFDLEGIASIAWSGFAGEMKDITDEVPVFGASATIADNSPVRDNSGTLYLTTSAVTSAATTTGNTTPAINNIKASGGNKAVKDTTNMIANRLSQLTVKPDAAFRTTVGASNLKSEYKMALTGGTITVNNNVTFLTPEELGQVNKPLRNITGARNISGDFTCYMRVDTDSNDRSQSFWSDLAQLTSVTKNEFEVVFDVGGTNSSGTDIPASFGGTARKPPNSPGVQFFMPQCNIEIPSHTVEDVISLSTTFNALPSTLTATDELFITTVGPVVA